MKPSQRSITESEIFGQFEAIREALSQTDKEAGVLRKLWKERRPRRLVYIGCGSGYSLACSAAFSAERILGLPARAMAAGDLMLHSESYRSLLDGALVFALSRSGSTTEVIEAMRIVRGLGIAGTGAICAAENAPILEQSDATLVVPSIFNRSVCQTGTVSGLFLLNLYCLGLWAGRDDLLKAIRSAPAAAEDFAARSRELLEDGAAKQEWTGAMLLADGDLWGLADEAAMAVREMALLPASAHHVLDVRHGPVALAGPGHLFLMLASRHDRQRQADLIRDLKKTGSRVVVLAESAGDYQEADLCLPLPPMNVDPVLDGLPFLFVAQLLALRRAEMKNINPDSPVNLSAWVKL